MELPVRKPNRLKNYDYSSSNYYFVTICTHSGNCIFGMDDKLTLYGSIARDELLNIPSHFTGVSIEKFIIMPNHIHIVISIGCNDLQCGVKLPDLSTVIGLYKSGVSKRIHQYNPKLKVWQKSYNDKIIRNEHAFFEICNYIEHNPMRWVEKYGTNVIPDIK